MPAREDGRGQCRGKERGCAVGMRIRNKCRACQGLVTSSVYHPAGMASLDAEPRKSLSRAGERKGAAEEGASGGEGAQLLPPSWLEGRRRALVLQVGEALRHGREKTSEQRKPSIS